MSGVELLDRHLDVLAHRQRGEQRAALEQHAPAAAHAKLLVGLGFGDRIPEHAHLALGGRLEADDRAHQHALAGARAADNAEDLAPADVELEPFVDRLIAEAVDQAAHLDRMLAVEPPAACAVRFAHPQPTSVKNTAKIASSTITAKIAWTTALVVRMPTSSLFPATCIPW